MSGELNNAAATTRRVVLRVGGLALSRFSAVQVCRNLRDIAGSFSVTYRDSGREALSFDPDLDPLPHFPSVLAGQACIVEIDGTQVLNGYIDEVDASWGANALNCTITGRDKTGDLVDCAASPGGPVEWRNVSPLQVAQIIAKPFGISAVADVDVGGVFPLFGIDADELALSAIEKACRQAALLVTSNGVGGLVLTRGGSSRAPAPLQRPGNIQDGGLKASWAQRFSDYYVLGQTSKSVKRTVSEPLMSVFTDPTTGTEYPIETSQDATVDESVSTLMTGHAVDPEITRYRPSVRMVKTQSGTASVTEQAYWGLRVAKGMGTTLAYKVLDWRAGPDNALWLPNALSKVTDPFVGLDKDMLISGVTYCYDGQGEYTQLELAGRTAFDRINEAADDPRYIQSRKPRSFGPTRNG
jgi:prophage tail gpP-like protein